MGKTFLFSYCSYSSLTSNIQNHLIAGEDLEETLKLPESPNTRNCSANALCTTPEDGVFDSI